MQCFTDCVSYVILSYSDKYSGVVDLVYRVLLIVYPMLY